MKKTALVLVLACLVACSSSSKKQEEPQPQPQPRIEDTPSKTAPAAEEKAPPKQEEPIAITIKKGDKRTPEAAFTGTPPPGQVCFDFQRVDLETVALPLFSKQAGVIVEYHGKTPRTLTLPLKQPTPWRDALALICQWTQTHVVRSQVAGRLELKEGFADPAPLLAKFDPNDKTTPTDAGAGTLAGDAGSPSASSGGGSTSIAGGGSTASSGGSTGSNSGGGQGGQIDTSEYQQPKQPGADRIDELRRGVTTTNSGVK